MWSCKKCENLNADTDRFCIICGTDKTIVVEPTVETPPRKEPTKEPIPLRTPPDYGDPKPGGPIKKTLETAALQERYDDLTRTANFFKAGVILCTIIAFVLFAQPFVSYNWGYTVFYLALGVGGQIEQICSIVFLAFAIVPAIFMLISFDSRKRNLPVTLSWVCMFAVAIYCGVIYFGNTSQTAVPILIVMCYALCVFFATMYVKKLIERENVFYKKGGFVPPKEIVNPPVAPARDTYRAAEKVSEPTRDGKPEPPKPHLKSTMR